MNVASPGRSVGRWSVIALLPCSSSLLLGLLDKRSAQARGKEGPDNDPSHPSRPSYGSRNVPDLALNSLARSQDLTHAESASLLAHHSFRASPLSSARPHLTNIFLSPVAAALAIAQSRAEQRWTPPDSSPTLSYLLALPPLRTPTPSPLPLALALDKSPTPRTHRTLFLSVTLFRSSITPYLTHSLLLCCVSTCLDLTHHNITIPQTQTTL